MFGAHLDMIVDRMSIATFFFILARLAYLTIDDDREQVFWIGVYLCLFLSDFLAHWLQVNNTYEHTDFETGKGTHKGGKTFVIRFYYKTPVLLMTCISAEAFSFSQYFAFFPDHFWFKDTLPFVILFLFGRVLGLFFKNVANFV